MAALPALALVLILLGQLFPAGSGRLAADELTDILSGFDTPEPGEDDLSDILEEFEDSATAKVPGEAAVSSDSPLHLSGAMGVAGAINLSSHRRPPWKNDRKGLGKLRGELDLTADLDLAGSWRLRAAGHAYYDAAYAFRGRDNYTRCTLDAYESEAELGEAWLQGRPLPGLDLKMGRQVVVWGKSDNIRVTDILNPMNKREPGMTDIEDLRLPVAMTRIDYGIGHWTLTGILVHEVRFDKRPVYGSSYFSSETPLPGEQTPAFAFDNQEAGLAFSGIFSGWEASIYAARVFDDTAHLELNQNGEYKRVHARITMLGTAAGLVRGNWLYKFEAAVLAGLEFAALPGETKSRLDVLAGVEYAGVSDTSISLEAANRHLFEFRKCLEASPDSAEEDDFQWALRISRDFFHERLNGLLLVQAYDPLGQDGALARLEFTFDLSDYWEAAAGMVLYKAGDKPAFQNIDENNRLFFRLHYAF